MRSGPPRILAGDDEGNDEEGEEETSPRGPLAALLRAVESQTRTMSRLLERRNDEDDMLGFDPGSSGSADGALGSGVRGVRQRERLREALDLQPDHFSAAVHKNMRRRMGLDSSHMAQSPPDPRLYMERYGGYDRQRELGLLGWLVAHIRACQWSGRHEAAMDRAALLMVVIEQAALDGGQMDLAWLFSLEEDPPAPVFTRPPAPATARGRTVTPLASQSWTTVSMAFLRELGTLQTRRADLARLRGNRGGGRGERGTDDTEGGGNSGTPAAKVSPKKEAAMEKDGV